MYSILCVPSLILCLQLSIPDPPSSVLRSRSSVLNSLLLTIRCFRSQSSIPCHSFLIHHSRSIVLDPQFADFNSPSLSHSRFFILDSASFVASCCLPSYFH